MDSNRGSSNGHSGANNRHTSQPEQPEQLLDVFKAAALSVTKLYKTSAAAESKARLAGYQECLDDLLSFLDKEKMGLGDGEGWRIRGWATERLDGRDAGFHASDSDDDADRADVASSPELTRASIERQSTPAQTTETATTQLPSSTIPPERPQFVVPSQETFTFQSTHQYPNIATLDLSDSSMQATGSTNVGSRAAKQRSRPKTSGQLGKGAGSKRKMDFSEFFPGCFNGKDTQSSGKRNRHV